MTTPDKQAENDSRLHPQGQGQEEHMSGSMDVMGSISPAAHALDRAQAKLRTPDPLFPQCPIKGVKLGNPIQTVSGPASHAQQGQEAETECMQGSADLTQITNQDADQDVGKAAEHPQPNAQETEQDTGQVASTPGPVVDRGPPARDPLKVTVKKRLEAEGRWKDIERERDEMMVLARKRFRSKAERQDWVYSELDRLYPPLEPTDTESADKGCTDTQRTLSAEQGNTTGRTDPDSVLLDKDVRNSPVNKDDGQIQGLGAIPEEWPELPANASLALDVGWVQANRLRIIEDRPMGPTLVHLERALSPAPSWAALGWLETSIRSYAKYVDVASRAASSESGEADVVKRERMAIEDVSTLLDEMREAT